MEPTSHTDTRRTRTNLLGRENDSGAGELTPGEPTSKKAQENRRLLFALASRRSPQRKGATERSKWQLIIFRPFSLCSVLYDTEGGLKKEDGKTYLSNLLQVRHPLPFFRHTRLVLVVERSLVLLVFLRCFQNLHSQSQSTKMASAQDFIINFLAGGISGA
jgi:hypothetical protein